MARVLTDTTDGGNSIFYAGRPDTHRKAQQQGEQIFRTEFTGNPTHPGKGLQQIGEDTFVLTYMVDSLTNLTRFEKKGKGFNERESFLQEQEVLAEHRLLAENVLTAFQEEQSEEFPVRKETDRLVPPKASSNAHPLHVRMENGKTYTIYLNPIHVHHTMNATGEFSKLLLDTLSGKDLEEKQNSQMLEKHLAPLARSFIVQEQGSEKGQLAENVLKELEANKHLKVHERLFLTDLLARLLDLPVVHHCKSVIDRTSVAGSVGAVNHYLLKNGTKFPNPPQDIIKTESYRELFMGILNMQHQVSQDSRMGVLADGTQTGRNTLGLQLNKGIQGMTGAIPFLPDAAVKENSNPRFKIFCAVTAAILLAPLYYLALAVASIYFKCKTGSFQGEMLLSLAAVPFTLKFTNIRHLNLKYTIDNDSAMINGQGRHINHHAPINKKEKTEPILIAPSYFYRKK
jgi:hypothetical protein